MISGQRHLSTSSQQNCQQNVNVGPTNVAIWDVIYSRTFTKIFIDYFTWFFGCFPTSHQSHWIPRTQNQGLCPHLKQKHTVYKGRICRFLKKNLFGGAKEEGWGLLLLIKLTDVDLFKIPRIESERPNTSLLWRSTQTGIHLIPYNYMLQFSSWETIRFVHVWATETTQIWTKIVTR